MVLGSTKSLVFFGPGLMIWPFPLYGVTSALGSIQIQKLKVKNLTIGRSILNSE